MLAFLFGLSLALADCGSRLGTSWQSEVDYLNAFYSRLPPGQLREQLLPGASAVAGQPKRPRFEWMTTVDGDQAENFPRPRDWTSLTIYFPEEGTMAYSPRAFAGWLERFPRIRPSALIQITSAHEMGHHMQKMAGVAAAAGSFSGFELFYRLELNADCLAGFYLGQSASRFDISEYARLVELAGSDVTSGIEQLTEAIVRARAVHPVGRLRRQWFERGFKMRRLEHCQTLSQPLPDLL